MHALVLTDLFSISERKKSTIGGRRGSQSIGDKNSTIEKDVGQHEMNRFYYEIKIIRY